MTSRAIVLVLLLPAASLVGCLADEDPTFVTATVQIETAREEARNWSQEATLVQARAVDPAQPPPNGSDEDATALAWKADPSIGDGRSQAWAYLFSAPDTETRYRVVVAGNGTVRQAEEVTPDSGGAYVIEPQLGPVKGWTVDSDEAAATVQEHDAAWPGTSQGGAELLTYTMLWGREDAAAFWVLGAETIDDESTHFVNASSGAYIGTSPPGNISMYEIGPKDGPPHEGGRFNGTVTPVEPEQSHSFEIEREGHPFLEVELVIPGDASGTLNLTVLGPQGEVRASGELGGSPGSSSGTSVRVEAPQTGTWTAQVVLEDGELQRYQVDWCAADAPPGVQFPNADPTASDPPCGENPDR